MNEHERLKESRLAVGLTQQALADEIGVALKTVQRWEQAKHPIPLARLRQIADVCRVSANWLAFGA